MSAAYLAELKTYFASEHTLRRMHTITNKTPKCVMCLPTLPAPRLKQGYATWFTLRWGVLSKLQQDDFRYFIGDRVLRLKAPSMFCVSVRPDAPRVVLFYVRSLLQDLADATFERPRACDRLEDALNALHDPQPEHRAFIHHAYDALPPAPPPAVPPHTLPRLTRA